MKHLKLAQHHQADHKHTQEFTIAQLKQCASLSPRPLNCYIVHTPEFTKVQLKECPSLSCMRSRLVARHSSLRSSYELRARVRARVKLGSGLRLRSRSTRSSDSGSYTMNMIFVLSIYYANNGICNMPQCLLLLGPLNATFWDI